VSFQKLVELVELLETIDAVREGMQELASGKGLSLDEVKEEVRKKHGIPV
jgi:hypothetical protein